jgi:hypothetical protein
VAELASRTHPPVMRVTRVGTGAGTLSFPDGPNVARLFVGEAEAGEGPALDPGPGLLDAGGEGRHAGAGGLPAWGWGSPEQLGGGGCPGAWALVVVLETQLDDATPADLAWLCDDLRAAGALEVYLEGVQMKKGRPAQKLTLICRPALEPPLMQRLLTRSTTLGVRRRCEWRRELDRREGIIETAFGPIRVKYAGRGAEGWTGEPEYESCREAAARAGVPIARVRRATLAALQPASPDPPAPLR